MIGQKLRIANEECRYVREKFSNTPLSHWSIKNHSKLKEGIFILTFLVK